MRGWARMRRGRVVDAALDIRRCLAAEADGWRLALPGAHALLAEALLEQGELDAAERELRAAEHAAARGSQIGACYVSAVRGRLRLGRGRSEQALASFLDCGSRLREAGIHNPAAFAWGSGAAVAAAQLGDDDRARGLVEEELEAARRLGTPGAVGAALTALGTVLGGDEGLAVLARAVTVLGPAQTELVRTRTTIAYGSALLRAGQPRTAREPLRVGLDLAQRLGAHALAARARRELIASGARPRRAALKGLEALTPREREVSELAARGMSNRAIAETLFVTVKTVEWHLRHAYEKLGVSTRAELRTKLENELTTGR
jgi:ATP/maltotriose-dependent transcriptional regulator MalT